MTGPIVGMVICVIAILVSTNMWMGEMVGAAMEDDDPHPLAFAALFATGASIGIYIWLSLALLS